MVNESGGWGGGEESVPVSYTALSHAFTECPTEIYIKLLVTQCLDLIIRC
jgi:hypothetical protein